MQNKVASFPKMLVPRRNTKTTQAMSQLVFLNEQLPKKEQSEKNRFRMGNKEKPHISTGNSKRCLTIEIQLLETCKMD